MFDLWIRDIEITALIALSAVLLVLPVQLLLCFKAKKRTVKLLPTAISAAAVLLFLGLMITATDWNAVGYVIFAVFSGVLLLFSGIGWGIWAIAKLVKQKKADRPHH